MREIKFRVYSKEHKKMLYYDTSIVPALTLNGVLELPMGTNDIGVAVMDNVSADFELMQFTGLHDKNGIDQYESDLVRKESNVGEIRWDELEARFRVYCDEAKPIPCNYPVGSGWEVIGNKYED